MRKFLWVPLLVASAVALGIGAGAALVYLNEPADDRRFDRHIARIASDYRVDPCLVRAVIWRESKFDPNTYGAAQERGLMQVTPIAAEDWVRSEKIDQFEIDDLYDPYTNIRAGTFYLSRALKRWNQAEDPLPFALAEYNAGRSHALRWVDPLRPTDPVAFKARIDFPTTREYIATVEAKLSEYRQRAYKPRWQALWEEWREKVSRWWGSEPSLTQARKP